jgi:hypothetical protein
LSGWQFDSNVDLLRGDDAKAAGSSATFLPFLNDLCEQKTVLRMYILAWDFSMLYSSIVRGSNHGTSIGLKMRGSSFASTAAIPSTPLTTRNLSSSMVRSLSSAAWIFAQDAGIVGRLLGV